MAKGRKPKYRDEFCDELIKYFSVEPYRVVTKKIVTKKGDVIEIEMDVANDTPTFAGFAAKIGVNRDTLLAWCKENQDFDYVYKLAKEYQENFLVVNGSKGLIPPAFAIFTLKNVAKWRDRQPDEHDTVVNNYNNLSDDQLETKINEKLKKLG